MKMSPLWFPSNSNPSTSSVRQHPPPPMMIHSAPPSAPPRGLQPPNNNSNQAPSPAMGPSYPRGPSMRGQYPPPNHVHHRRPFGAPMGPAAATTQGSKSHIPSASGRPPSFAPHPPPMRLPPPINGRPHPNYAPPPGRMNYAPHMHRQMPPHSNLNRGIPQHHLHRGPPSMPPLIGPPRFPQSGLIMNHPTSAPHPTQGPSQPPLRELNTQNILPPSEHFNRTIDAKAGLLEIPVEDSSDAQDAATDAAEILLGLRRIPSPVPSQEEKQVAHREDTPSLATLPDEPICLPTRLAVPEDEAKLNSMHCFLRSDLLELFVVERSRSPKHALKSNSPSPAEVESKQGYKVGCASGRVGLRCVHCAKARVRNASSDGEAPMAVFYPKSISELYRLVTSWQRVHLRKCRNLPPAVRETYEKTRQDKSRGKTQWWVTSAKEIGLVDCTSKAGGIRFGVAPNGLSA